MVFGYSQPGETGELCTYMDIIYQPRESESKQRSWILISLHFSSLCFRFALSLWTGEVR